MCEFRWCPISSDGGFTLGVLTVIHTLHQNAYTRWNNSMYRPVRALKVHSVCVCVCLSMLPSKDSYLCHWKSFNKVCIQSVYPLIASCWEIIDIFLLSCAHYGRYMLITGSIYEALRPHSPLLWLDLCWNCVEVQGDHNEQEEEEDEWRGGWWSRREGRGEECESRESGIKDKYRTRTKDRRREQKKKWIGNNKTGRFGGGGVVKEKHDALQLFFFASGSHLISLR